MMAINLSHRQLCLRLYPPLSWMTQGLLLLDSSTRGELLFREPDRKKKTILHFPCFSDILRRVQIRNILNSSTCKPYMFFYVLQIKFGKSSSRQYQLQLMISSFCLLDNVWHEFVVRRRHCF